MPVLWWGEAHNCTGFVVEDATALAGALRVAQAARGNDGTIYLMAGQTITNPMNVTINVVVPSTTTTSAYWPDLAMFLPTGSGALYYHSISAPTSATVLPYGQHQTPFYQAAASAYQAAQARQLPRPKPLAKPAILAGRRALRRSIDLFRMLRPKDEIRTFLRGEPLIVRGHRFDYRIQKHDNLLRHTMNPHSVHIPYDFRILDKASGKNLAKGCTIIPGTPVIDQLLALILHIQDPDEEVNILWNTNWSPDITRLLPAEGRHRMRLAA
jgi:hypothetical protein